MMTTLPFGNGRSLAAILADSGTGFDTDARDFDLLNAALAATGLTGALADADAELTLFAPTDAAFLRLARDLGFAGTDEAAALTTILGALTTLGAGDPLPLLTDILTYHLVDGPLPSTGSIPTLLTGSSVTVFGRSVVDADPDAPDPSFVGGREVQAGNGALQAIDRVLLPVDLAGNAAPPPPATVAALLAASGTGFDTIGADFDLLRTAVEAAGLTGALADAAADLTVFAPTDAAFLELARRFGFTGSGEAEALDAILAALTTLAPGGDPIPLLADILLYHVVDGRFGVAQLRALESVPTLAGDAVTVAGGTIIDADPEARDARFVPGATDISTGNGAVQAIDRVLLPLDLVVPGDAVGGSIADQLAVSGAGFDTNAADFDILNAALAAAGLTATLDDLALDLTLFAPTDAAFQDLARRLGVASDTEQAALDGIVGALTTLGGGDPIPLLTQILTYHVAAGVLTEADILGSATVATLNGAAITPFGRMLGDLDPTLGDARLLGGRADLPAENGIVQAINQVLLPIDITEAAGTAAPLPTIAALLAQSGTGLDAFGGDFDILNAALATAGLTSALADPDAALTLLAPTDDAFIGLAQALGFAGDDEAGALAAVTAALATLGGGDPVPLLTDILETHVLGGVFSRQRLDEVGSATSLQGLVLEFDGRLITDAEPDAEVALLAQGGNLEAANGAVQAILGVLLPVDLALI